MILFVFFVQDERIKTIEYAATVLQVRFENAVLDQKPLHTSGCEGNSLFLICYFWKVYYSCNICGKTECKFRFRNMMSSGCYF